MGTVQCWLDLLILSARTSYLKQLVCSPLTDSLSSFQRDSSKFLSSWTSPPPTPNQISPSISHSQQSHLLQGKTQEQRASLGLDLGGLAQHSVEFGLSLLGPWDAIQNFALEKSLWWLWAGHTRTGIGAAKPEGFHKYTKGMRENQESRIPKYYTSCIVDTQ